MVYIKILVRITLALYLLSVLWLTVFKRPISFPTAPFDMFWSYRDWFDGNMERGREIVGNIVMFIPFGFLTSIFLKKRVFISIMVFALIFSGVIETLQIVLIRGLFEWDDVFNNTIGAVVGFFVFKLLSKTTDKPYLYIICGVVIIVCATAIIVDKREGETDITSRGICFQVDEVECVNGQIQLTGFAFCYTYPTANVLMCLKPVEKGKSISMDITKVERHDVDSYFSSDYDYSKSGFVATGVVDPDKEYEILIRFPWSIFVSTGVYVTGDRIHFATDKEFKIPVGIEEITEKGFLRVYRPDVNCWVYQLNNSLYWIVGKDFQFENDDATIIQFQLWTTQEEKLPENRIENGWMWDNRSSCFEDYEIQCGDGSFRIMKRELPTEYSITSILTGYYKEKKWFWKNYFRPIYIFDK